MAQTVRIGILGAAGIAPSAIINPAKVVKEAEIVAVAARNRDDAEKFAKEHGIPKVHDTYEDVLADPDIDLIYNPTPNGLHGKWTIAAVQAGKHVLAEKPFTANADEAVAVAGAISATDRIVVEAFHYRYHPAMLRVIEIVQSGELGDITSIESGFVVPGAPRDDIRWNLALAGGGLMDVGCYPVHLVRHVIGAEPTVMAATAIQSEPEVDGEITIDLQFPGGVKGKVRSSMIAETPEIYATVTGTKGELHITNPFLPHLGATITVTTDGVTRSDAQTAEASYNFQLRAVVDAILRGEPVITDTVDAIANMQVIDAAYHAAGMDVRKPTL